MIRKLILKKLEVEIKRVTLWRGLPTHNHMLLGDHMMDTIELCNNVKASLSQMIMEPVATNSTDEVGKVVCQLRESDLSFLTRAK